MSDEEKKNQNTENSTQNPDDKSAATDHPEQPEAAKDPVEKTFAEETTEAPAPEEKPHSAFDEAPLGAKPETDTLQEELQAAAEEDVPVQELPNRDIKPGMLIRVHERIIDISPKGQERERVQVFEGMVMGLKGKGVGRTMTVRKDSKGFMVEKIFPLSSPNIVKIEVKKQYRVRRAKLSHLRGKFKRKLKEIKKDEK